MTTNFLKTRYRYVLVIFIILFMFSGFSQYAFVSGILPVRPILWTFLLLVLVCPLLFNPKVRQSQIRPLVLWGYAFVLIVSVWQLANFSAPLLANTILASISFVIFIIVTLTLLADRTAVSLATASMALVTIFSAFLNVYEFMHPGVFSNVPGRAAGLYINPNSSAAALVIGMILGYRSVVSRFRLTFVACVGIGVLATFSRGGIVCWVLALTLLQLTDFNKRNVLQAWAIGLVTAALLYLSPIWPTVEDQLNTDDVYTESMLNRIQLSPDQSLTSDARVSLLHQAWEMYTLHPVFGNGNGTPLLGGGVDPQGPHNMFLSLLIQYGVVGGLLFLALILIVFYAGKARADMVPITFSLFLLADSFFTHNMFEQAQYAVAIALACALPIRNARSTSYNAPGRSHEVSVGSEGNHPLKEAI